MVGRCIDGVGTVRVSIAPSSERFLGARDTTLVRKALLRAAIDKTAPEKVGETEYWRRLETNVRG